jgi:hypothetical protein
MATRQRDALGYAGMAVLGALLLLWLIPAYCPEYPGYGVPATLVPNLAAGGILLLAALGLARTVLAYGGTRRPGAGTGIAWGHLARFFIPCFLLMSAMNAAGFIPAALVFMLFIQWFCGQRKPLTLAAVALAPVLILYALMRFGLGVPLP